MNLPETIDPEMTVDEIMRRWPTTIRVVMRHHMLCVGCPIGIFHTVVDACQAHRIDAESFSAELLEAMQCDPAANDTSAFYGDDFQSARGTRRLADRGR